MGHDVGFCFLTGTSPEAGRADPDSAPTSARHREVLVEAELRAEHQAAARTTMLDLAHSLESLLEERKRLLRQIEREKTTSSILRSKCRDLEEQLEEALAEEEKRQAAELVQKGFDSGNQFIFSMLLEKSREAYGVSLFADGDAPPGEDPSGGAAGSDADGGGKVFSLDCLMSSKGDQMTIKWIFKTWMHEVNKTKQRLAEEAAARERQRLEEERERRIQEEIEKRVGAVRRMAEELDRLLKAANETIRQHDAKQKELHDKLNAQGNQAADRERQLAAANEQLQADFAQSQRRLGETQERLAKLQQDFHDLQEALRRSEAKSEAEMARLRAAIKLINSELEQAVILAKHMREAALKAKRDAAQSVSPEKFAQLIAELEDMRDRLSKLGRQYSAERDGNASLQLKLDKNQRRMELERQFLPLLHKARGPLGPKTSVGEGARKQQNWDLVGAAPLPAAPGTTDKKLHASQSATSLGGSRSLGGPLGGM
mmetsp:Transcript_107481/g.303880  ORF Transcript_107481/g.303880 Transcript_107481/m.303880 type:complete len:486 (-) Transcript_107481:111-1568(-)